VTSFYGNFGNFDTYENRIASLASRDEHDRRRKLDLVNGIEISDGALYR